VRSEQDLDVMYEWWRTIFERLIAQGVKPTCVRDIMASVDLA
jgi:hypothetical protein